ncbi:hypothetical protein ACHMW6_06135 [Pseudoduganella sp. UC29_106]
MFKDNRVAIAIILLVYLIFGTMDYADTVEREEAMRPVPVVAN